MFENGARTLNAERAFKRADERVVAFRWQVTVTAFAVRSQFEHLCSFAAPSRTVKRQRDEPPASFAHCRLHRGSAGKVGKEFLFERSQSLRPSVFDVAEGLPKTIADDEIESFKNQADWIEFAATCEGSKQPDRHADSRPLASARPVQYHAVPGQSRENGVLDMFLPIRAVRVHEQNAPRRGADPPQPDNRVQRRLSNHVRENGDGHKSEPKRRRRDEQGDNQRPTKSRIRFRPHRVRSNPFVRIMSRAAPPAGAASAPFGGVSRYLCSRRSADPAPVL